jgi:DNA modification methylase
LTLNAYVSDPDFTLYLGDVREVLAQLPAESVDCALTSPPFYALRDYGVDGQIGLEETPEAWVDELVAVFREVRRVLRPTGTLWVECGDSYCANQGQVRENGVRIATKKDGAWQTAAWSGGTTSPMKHPTKPKDLLGQPWMLAFALRADGWWLRQAIIWHKPNAMPESATDRCTTAHSYVFLLSKQARYHFDAEAIAEPAEWARWGDQTVPKYEGTDTASGWMQSKSKAELRSGRIGRYQERAMYGKGDGTTPRKLLSEASRARNPRSVWSIPTRGYAEAHFATWPEALCERIIKAGCPEGGTVLDPFMGSGTTALVARKLGRKSIGVELNADYAALAAKRLSQLSLLA